MALFHHTKSAADIAEVAQKLADWLLQTMWVLNFLKDQDSMVVHNDMRLIEDTIHSLLRRQAGHHSDLQDLADRRFSDDEQNDDRAAAASAGIRRRTSIIILNGPWVYQQLFRCPFDEDAISEVALKLAQWLVQTMMVFDLLPDLTSSEAISDMLLVDDAIHSLLLRQAGLMWDLQDLADERYGSTKDHGDDEGEDNDDGAAAA